ncbi:MAG: response regulator transcription factor, partial [Acidimicrobiales bacterium]
MDVALDGAHGEWLASGQGYDAIVMDIMLPGVNGYQLCARFRERGNWTPILMLTAKDGGYDEVEALDTGSDDFLSKPFSYVVLVARLRALLRRGAVERTPALRRGNLSVDPAPRRCARGAVEIDMKAKGLSVTEYLMRRAGEVVTKS